MLLLSVLLSTIPQILASRLGHSNQLPLKSPQDHSPFDDDFDSFARDTLDEFLTPGVSIAVVQGNNTYAKGYGFANIASRLPVMPRTLFYTGSTTKSFSAAVASKLVDSNESAYEKIRWESKLADLIREDFVLEDEYATNHISLIDAMSHRTGMPRHDLSWINGNLSMRKQVRGLRHLPLHNELRSKYEYCNLMFTAVSHAIEVVTGTAMRTLLREWIWDKLGMHETFYDLADALELTKKDDKVVMATGYLYDNSTKAQIPVRFSDIPPANGAGGVISNVLDYTKWIRMFLHPTNTSNPISESAINEMTTAHMPIPASWRPATGTAYYGLGLHASIYRGYETVGHDGGVGGYMTTMLWIPSLDWGVVILQNTYSLAAEILAWRLLDDILRTPDRERFDMTNMARSIQAKGIARIEKARETLYPDVGDRSVAPALAVQAYEGVYYHPAYHGYRCALVKQSDHAESGHSSDTPTPLCCKPATIGYSNVTITLSHVSGEHWFGHARYGPGSFLVDDLMKAKFEVGVDAKVAGLGLQIEPGMSELAWFEKIE